MTRDPGESRPLHTGSPPALMCQVGCQDQLTAVSLFAGVGGFDLACERAGVKVVAAVEIDKAARSVLARRFPTTRLYEDVQRVHRRAGCDCEDCLPDGRIDIVCGGFPCQDLSVAGRRAGLAGLRSGLFYELARIIAETAPRWVVLENVPGLLSSNGGRDMAAVVGTLGDLGYGWAYRVLDAQFFGVPQRRRRVFVVGCLGDRAAPVQVLLEPEGGTGNPPKSRQAGEGVAASLTAGVAASRGVSAPGRRQEDDINLITHALTSEGADASEDGTGRGTPLVAFHVTQDQISGAIAPAMGTGNRQGCATIGVAFAENQRGEVLTKDVADSLKVGGGKPGQGYPAALTDTAVRRLTPMECERLQGFPDGWTDGQADAARYRQMGNAVAVPVVEWIVCRLVAVAATGEVAA